MKIVINKCYGGFGLSKKAVMRYAELAGLTLYHERSSICDQYYFVPPEQYHQMHVEAEATRDYSKLNEAFFTETYIDRDDPKLVQVVEELGEESWGEFAELSVVTIPDDVEWEINDYDGIETIAEVHRTWG